MQQSSDEQILKDLYYELAREMPAERVGFQMYTDHLLLPKEWEIFTKLTEDKGEYLLECLQRSRESGFMEKFCSVLDKIGAENLLKTISYHRNGNAMEPHRYYSPPPPPPPPPKKKLLQTVEWGWVQGGMDLWDTTMIAFL